MYVGEHTKLIVVENHDCSSASEAKSTRVAVGLVNEAEQRSFKKMPRLSSETVDDFRSRLGKCLPLERKLTLTVPYVLVDANDLATVFGKRRDDSAWDLFEQKYPGSPGVISFSAVGFNRNFTQALVQTNMVCGTLCGSGTMVLLLKQGRTWRVTKKVPIWVS
jgi:hypothetical protein